METNDAGDVHNAAVAGFHHWFSDGSDAVEGTFEVDIDHPIPVIVFHAKHQGVFGYASVVDEDARCSHIGDHSVYECLD